MENTIFKGNNRTAILTPVELTVTVRMAEMDLLKRNLRDKQAEERRNLGVTV